MEGIGKTSLPPSETSGVTALSFLDPAAKIANCQRLQDEEEGPREIQDTEQEGRDPRRLENWLQGLACDVHRRKGAGWTVLS